MHIRFLFNFVIVKIFGVYYYMKEQFIISPEYKT